MVVILGYSLLGILFGYLALTDMKTFRLPDVCTLPAAVLGIGVQALQGEWTTALWGAAFGFALLKGIQAICRYAYKRECIGSGDVKLMLSLGALLGAWGAYATIAGGVASAYAMSRCGNRSGDVYIPFAPYLLASALVVFGIQQVWPCVS